MRKPPCLSPIAVITTGALLLAGCGGPVLDPAGDIARQQRNLIFISTGLMLLIIVPVMVLTVLFAWRYRKGGGGKYDPKFDHSTSLELVIWSAPLLIVIALGALTWASTHLLDPFRPVSQVTRGQPVARGTKPLHVQVVALDWKWLFIYPDLGIATVNELALPVNVPVRFDITSTNMMNTFHAPTMAGMVYAMPGMRSTLHAVMNRPGRYEGQSSNYSGAGFSDMRFKLLAVDRANFDRWVATTRGQGRGALVAANFMKLAKPSERAPVMRFAQVEPDLFRRVVERCVEPGKMCMSQVMAHDRRHGGGDPNAIEAGAGMPSGRDSAPLGGDKPEGALFKDGNDKGSGTNVTKPRQPGAPGTTDPGNAKNRDLSLNLPVPILPPPILSVAGPAATAHG